MTKPICLCCKCRKPVFKWQDIKDNFVYSNDGVLKYIELYHSKCWGVLSICKISPHLDQKD